jgi:hypothetical protein
MDQYHTEYFNIHALSLGAQGHAMPAATPDVSVMGIAVETGGLDDGLASAGLSKFANGSVRTPGSDVHSLATLSVRNNQTVKDQKHLRAYEGAHG